MAINTGKEDKMQPPPSTSSSSYRWENGVSNNVNVSMGSTEKGIGIKVHVLMGNARSIVCRNLHCDMGKITEAIVFDKVQVVMGRIDEIHCLHSTDQNIVMSTVGRITYHTVDELVDLALEKMGME